MFENFLDLVLNYVLLASLIRLFFFFPYLDLITNFVYMFGRPYINKIACEPIESTYINKKCPFTGSLPVTDNIVPQTRHSTKMDKTIIVKQNYLHFVKTY